jgi:hypothetical protein
LLHAVRGRLLGLLSINDDERRRQLVDLQRTLAELLGVVSRQAPSDSAEDVKEGVAAHLDDDDESADKDDNECDEDQTHRESMLTRSEQGLRLAAMAYEKEAGRKSALMGSLYILALSAITVGTLMGWYLITHRALERYAAAGGFLAQWTPAAGLLAVGFYLIHQAGRIGRGADELRRLQRQFLGLLSYLRPLPSDTQNLLLAAMTQRLFPRLIEDDPLREEDWFPEEGPSSLRSTPGSPNCSSNCWGVRKS